MNEKEIVTELVRTVADITAGTIRASCPYNFTTPQILVIDAAQTLLFDLSIFLSGGKTINQVRTSLDEFLVEISEHKS